MLETYQLQGKKTTLFVNVDIDFCLWGSKTVKFTSKPPVLVCLFFSLVFFYVNISKKLNWFDLEFTACFKPLIFGLLFNGHVRRWRGGRRLWVAMISGKLRHVIWPIPKVLFKERMCIRRGYEPRVTGVTVRGQEVLVRVRMWPSESGITANQKYCSKNM